jgi:hypothetical protein
MAHMASDGRGFTNRPQMKQHEARIAAGKQHGNQKVAIDSNPSGPSAEHESDHTASHVSCPHCGQSFDADEQLAGRDKMPVGTGQLGHTGGSGWGGSDGGHEV